MRGEARVEGGCKAQALRVRREASTAEDAVRSPVLTRTPEIWIVGSTD